MLKISHISKTFNPGTVNEKKAITDLSLELKKGDFATIIGSNGAGKSTLFNAICGDFLTDAGSIELDGRDITFMPQHARAKEIGRLYQDPMRGTAPGQGGGVILFLRIWRTGEATDREYPEKIQSVSFRRLCGLRGRRRRSGSGHSEMGSL